MFIRIKEIKREKGIYQYYAYKVQSHYDREKKGSRSNTIQTLRAFTSLKPLKRETLYKIFSELITCANCHAITKLILDHTQNILKCQSCLTKETQHSGTIDLQNFNETTGY